MSDWRLILASLRHYRRIHLAVGLGVAVATAVLTGALIVGDSVRGSLRVLTLERLGRIDSVLVAAQPFRAALADELVGGPAFKTEFTAAEPAILTTGTVESGGGNAVRRATRVEVLGCRQSFWSLGDGGPREPLAAGEAAITEPLANELGVAVGDEIGLRIPKRGAIPADSPLGAKDPEKTSRFARYKVAAVLAPRGLARFGLVPTQHQPRNVFVPLDSLARLIEKPGRANAILLGGREVERAVGENGRASLTASFRPRLEDLGLRVDELVGPTGGVQISADQLVLPDAVVQAAKRAFGGEHLQPVVTYLANTIRVGEFGAERKIPYSTITGVDSTAELGPLVDAEGRPIELADDEIALNRWAAEDLQARIGDRVTVTFYEPESTHGRLRERQPPTEFRLRAIVDLATRDGLPTRANDPKLTPELPGVTDQRTIADWDLPFELVEEVRPRDEAYWEEYRTTPKAFVSLATAKRLWSSRWGTISLLRLPNSVVPSAAKSSYVANKLVAALTPWDAGMSLVPVKEQGLAAASGTTPFDGLFLAFSFFLIASAVMLIALLFQLGVEQRAKEIGTLAAVGVNRRRIALLLGKEGLAVTAIGSVMGVAAGLGYAWLMIYGLRTWWLAAIATPFLALHVSSRSLILGLLIGMLVSLLTINLSIRRLVRLPAERLLRSSRWENLRSWASGQGRRGGWPMIRVALVLIVVGLVYTGFKRNGEGQAGVFFGSGAAVLVLLLGEVRYRLTAAGRRGSRRGLTLLTLSVLNTERHPDRSALTIGLVAAAAFLIVAVSAFWLDTGEGGTGGFALVATSDQPIYYDLNTEDGRAELGFADAASVALDHWRIYSLRVAAGEDASCLNLYRPTQPTVFGVPDALIERGGFDWAAFEQGTGGKEQGEKSEPRSDRTGNPWTLLREDLGRDEAGRSIVPVVLDANTAVYSLHLRGVGSQREIRDSAGRPVTLQVVGLLNNSVLQGKLLVSEANFLRMFPETGGYRFFLIEENSSRHSLRGAVQAETKSAGENGDRKVARAAGTASMPAVLDAAAAAQVLESTLGADGIDAVQAREELAGFLAVQNTYLSTFQSLGALGLLLGTIGLAVVQLRSVLERRRELALMRAAGFRSRRLVRMVVLENAVLLMGGLLIGCVAAAVALVPQWAPQQASVPWIILSALLGTIAVVGLAAGWLATRSALRAPLVPALRGE